MSIYSQDTVTWELRATCSTHGAQQFPQLLVLSSSDSSIFLNTESEQMDSTSKENIYLKQPHQLTNRIPGRSKRKRDEMVGDREDESGMELLKFKPVIYFNSSEVIYRAPTELLRSIACVPVTAYAQLFFVPSCTF
jgi:hypothetical protein